MNNNQTNRIESHNKLSIVSLVMCCLGIIAVLMWILEVWEFDLFGNGEDSFLGFKLFSPLIFLGLAYIFTAINSAIFCRIIRSLASNEEAKPCPGANYLTAAATIAVLLPPCFFAMWFIDLDYQSKIPYYFAAAAVSLILLSTILYIIGYSKLRKCAFNYQHTGLRLFWWLTVANVFILTCIDAILLFTLFTFIWQ